jgi:uncharacterized protein involved in outer membrane biogenesis
VCSIRLQDPWVRNFRELVPFRMDEMCRQDPGRTAGTFFGLLLIAAGTTYFVATSDFLRGQLEGRASDPAGRKTQIAKVAVQWGWTSNVTLEGIEVANAKRGKAPYMLKVDEVDFDIRLWPLLGGNLVLPRLVLHKPEVQVERGDKEQLNWSMDETPVVTGAAKAPEPDTASTHR